jgi:ABC-type spermidine/putrescine transport system permease subunit I
VSFLRRPILGVLPAVLFTAAMLGLPLVLLFVLGFLEIDRGTFAGHISLHGYASIFADPFYAQVFLRTLLIAIGVTLLCLVIGYPVAYVFYRARGASKGAILLCVLAPLLTSTLVRTFGWIVILGREGFLNQTLLALGVVKAPIQFLFNLKGVVIGMTQVLLPYMVLPVMASLETIAPELEEAAVNLGASSWQTFWRVIIPQTVPGISGGVTLVFILAFSEFPVPALLGGSTFKSLPVYIYQTMATLLDWSRGAALASMLLIGSGLAVYLLQLLFKGLSPWTRSITRAK